MINNKKGLSTVIVTVLLIGLTIVAVGIVWAVVSNTLNRGNQGTELSVKCLGVQVTAASGKCSGLAGTSPSCYFVLERTGTGQDSIAGVKLVLVNANGTKSTTPADVAGNIDALGSKAYNISAAASLILAPNKLETTVYFTDETGTVQNCQQPSTFTF